MIHHPNEAARDRRWAQCCANVSHKNKNKLVLYHPINSRVVKKQTTKALVRKVSTATSPG
jgi:hypothetical protein